MDNFSPYDPSPERVKYRTDLSRQLRLYLDQLDLDVTKLTRRERKALSQLRHYLGTTFGGPMGEDYYAGDWMMGPDYYCRVRFCRLGVYLDATLDRRNGFQPFSMEDIEKIIEVYPSFCTLKGQLDYFKL